MKRLVLPGARLGGLLVVIFVVILTVSSSCAAYRTARPSTSTAASG